VRLAALALVAGLALAGQASAAGTQTIRVTSVTIKDVAHDLKPKGPSKGDTVTYSDRLVNAVAQFGRKRGAAVGRDTAVVTLSSTSAATIRGRTSLPGGTITLSGSITLLANGGLVAPITGGTGKFAHVRGTLTVGPGKDHVLNTYRLTRPSSLVA
jgi:hypothetical protein